MLWFLEKIFNNNFTKTYIFHNIINSKALNNGNIDICILVYELITPKIHVKRGIKDIIDEDKKIKQFF